MPKSRGIHRPKHRWARPQLYLLHRRYANTPTRELAEQFGCEANCVYRKAVTLGLSKSAAYLASHCRLRDGSGVGAGTRFQRGHVPFNKGIKGWDAGGRSQSTRFTPGQRSCNWVPVGTLRINSEGFLDRKVADTGLSLRNWVTVHRLVWTAHHGPVPAGHVVAFKPGLHTTELRLITLERLELLSRAQLMKRNSYHYNYPKPIAELIQLRGALNRQINKRE